MSRPNKNKKTSQFDDDSKQEKIVIGKEGSDHDDGHEEEHNEEDVDDDNGDEDYFPADEESDDEVPSELANVHWEFEREGVEEMEEFDDSSVFTFTNHKGPIYTCAIHPTKSRIIATGGGDDRGFVFMLPEKIFERKVNEEPEGKQISDDEKIEIPEEDETKLSQEDQANILFEYKHTDSICCIAFSHDGTYLATTGYDGHVKIWESETGVLKYDFDGLEDIDWAQWHPQFDFLFAGSKDGNIWMWFVPTGECAHVFAGHSGSITCGVVLSKTVLVTGSEDGTVHVWGLKQKICRHVFSGNGYHQGPVTCLASHKDNELVLSGSEDGTACLLHIPNKRIIATFVHKSPNSQQNKKKSEEDKDDDDDEEGEGEETENTSVESVGFCHSEDWCATGGMDGKLKIWNISSQQLRLTCEQTGGVTKLEWHLTLPIVFTSSTDGNIRIWDARSGELQRTLSGHQDIVLNLQIRPFNPIQIDSNESDEKNDALNYMIVSNSDDETLKVFIV